MCDVTGWMKLGINILEVRGKEIRVEGNRGNGKHKWIAIIEEDVRTCDVSKNTIRDKEGCRGRIQVADPVCVGWRRK